METSAATRFGTVAAEFPASDLLEALDMAFLGSFEARNGRWGLLADLVHFDLSTTRATRYGRAFEDAGIATQLTAFSGYGLYRVAETPQVAVDLGAGLRAFAMSLDVDLDGRGPVADVALSSDERWVVPVVAARMSVPLGERWFAAAFADAGAASGDSTWQAAATVGYRFNARWSMQAGYRHMSLDKDLDGKDVAIDLSGPVLGVGFRF